MTKVKTLKCRSAWWRKEAQDLSSAEKMDYRKMLTKGLEEGRLAHEEATVEAKDNWKGC